MDDLVPAGTEKSDKKSPSPARTRSPPSRESSRERIRKRRSRSRERRRRPSRSRSRSPLPFRGGGFRGNRNNNNRWGFIHPYPIESKHESLFRFGRRSPDRFRGRFNNRFNNDRRSRSRSRDNNRGRRFDRNRRSRSESLNRNNSNNNVNYMQQQQDPNAMYSDAYGNYIPGAPAPPQFGLAQMGSQFNSYDFQAASSYPPPAPTFGGIACPAPPGMSEGWIPPPAIQHEESEEEKMKRDGEIDFHKTWQQLVNFSLFSCCWRRKETTTRRVKKGTRPIHQSIGENETRVEGAEAGKVQPGCWPWQTLTVAENQRLHQGEREASGESHFPFIRLHFVTHQICVCLATPTARTHKDSFCGKIQAPIDGAGCDAKPDIKKCFSFFFSGFLRKFVRKMKNTHIHVVSIHLVRLCARNISKKNLMHI